MGNIKDLIVRLLVDDAEMSKFEKAGTKAVNWGNAVDKGARIGAGALALLAGGAIVAGDAAAEAEQSQMQLQYALDQFPLTADTNAAALYKLNSALALKTRYDDDAYASGQAILAQYGLTGAQLEQLTPLLGDYAAKMNIDVATAAEQLGTALLGNGRSLKAVGIDWVDAGNVADNYGQLLAGLSSQVGGFAQQQATTASGANAVFKNSLGELSEELGQDLLPVMVDGAHALSDFAVWARQNSDLVKGLAVTTGVLAGAVVLTAGAYKGFLLVQGIAGVIQGIRAAQEAATIATNAGSVATTANTVATWANNAAWYANPVVWIIAAIIVAIGLLVAAGIWLYENWDGVTKFIGEAWANVCGFIQYLGDQIAAWWNGLWSGIANFVTAAWNGWISFVSGVWFGYLNWLRSTGDGIAAWWNGLWSGIGSFFGSIWSGLQGIVRGAWNGIIGWIESGVNKAVALINGLIKGFNAVGGTVGLHLSLIPSVNIPRLASGGIALGPQLAMVGDNPGGREAILPLDSPAARDLLGGGNDEPVRLDDHSIDRLADRLARAVRQQQRMGGQV